jgi:programmed cell death protein 5
MSSIEELKKKRLEELQAQMSAEQQAAAERQAAEQIKKGLLAQILTKEARERLNNVRSAHPEVAEQVELALIQAVQMGQISKIDDAQLKEILSRASAGKKEFRIVK